MNRICIWRDKRGNGWNQSEGRDHKEAEQASIARGASMA
jgi:hypothetical protein